MNRAMLGAGIGWMLGMVALAGYGAWWGFVNGADWVTPKLPPGWSAAALNATDAVVYFWWLAGVIGALIGGCAGFGSWLVRPRRTERLA